MVALEAQLEISWAEAKGQLYLSPSNLTRHLPPTRPAQNVMG